MNILFKKKIIYMTLFLAFVLLINIGISYSYYLGKVIGNETESTIGINSAGIDVVYDDNNGQIIVENIEPNWSFTKHFSVSSNISNNEFTTTETKLWYEILLYIDQNNLPSDTMTYSFIASDTKLGNGEVAEAKTNAGIATGANEEGINLGNGYFTVGDNKHDYNITFNYTGDALLEGDNYTSIFSVRLGANVIVKSKINIDLDGGTIEGGNTRYITKGETIVLSTPIKDNYVFKGWIITSGEGSVSKNSITVNDEVLDICALWKIGDFTPTMKLILSLNGGTTSQDTINEVTNGEVFTLEEPTKDGYVFRGWKLIRGDATFSDDQITLNDEIVKIEATWESVVPKFTYTGTYTLLSDSANNWRVKFLTSGTLTFQTYGNADSGIDLFLVGGGGNGSSNTDAYWGAGGGGGYTRTIRNITISTGQEYSFVVGGARQETSAFNYKAAPGNNPPSAWKGGNGGSGGGIFTASVGTDGYNGVDYHTGDGWIGGKGQRSVPGPNGETGTTREFGESTGDLYSAGGTGTNGENGTANTGNGGGGTKTSSGKGGSGIVIIRNKR